MCTDENKEEYMEGEKEIDAKWHITVSGNELSCDWWTDTIESRAQLRQIFLDLAEDVARTMGLEPDVQEQDEDIEH
jgi:hypothetical protein